MRPSLLPGLLAAAARNLKRGASAVRLFEIGRRYLRRRKPSARRWAWCSPAIAARAAGASGKAAAFDAFDAKAEALALLAAAGAPVDNLQVMGEAGRRLASRPVRHAAARPEDGARRASACSIRRVLKAFDLDGAVAAVELYLDAIPAQARSRLHARRPTRRRALQAVRATSPSSSPPSWPPSAGPRGHGRRQGDDHRRARVRRLRRTGTARQKSARDRGHAPAGRRRASPTSELKAIADKVVAAAAKLGATLRG